MGCFKCAGVLRLWLAGLVALLAIAGAASPAAASVCEPDGTGCTQAGLYTFPSPGVLVGTENGLQLRWVSSYVEPYASGVPLYWRVNFTFTNISTAPATVTCVGDSNTLSDREYLSGGSGDNGGYVTADNSFCNANPSYTTSLAPGATESLDGWDEFHNVPWPGTSVAFQEISFGTSAYVNPFPSSAPPPAPVPAPTPAPPTTTPTTPPFVCITGPGGSCPPSGGASPPPVAAGGLTPTQQQILQCTTDVLGAAVPLLEKAGDVKPGDSDKVIKVVTTANQALGSIPVIEDLTQGKLVAAYLDAAELIPGDYCAELLVDTISRGGFTQLQQCVHDDTCNEAIMGLLGPLPCRDVNVKCAALNSVSAGNLVVTSPGFAGLGKVKLNIKRDPVLDGIGLNIYNPYTKGNLSSTLTLQSRLIRKHVTLVRGWTIVNFQLGRHPGLHHLTISIRRGRKVYTHRYKLKVVR